MKFFFLFCTLLILLFSCKKQKEKRDLEMKVAMSAYPENVGNIIIKNCATEGCHTSNDKDAAAKLSLSSWTEMWLGAGNGSVVTNGRHNMSQLFLFSNTYAELGNIASPTMPPNKSPLSYSDIQTLSNWIDAGAPNNKGELMFPDNDSRSKVYFTNQGCDLVGVMDAKTSTVYKYIDAGISAQTESPHQVKVSPDGKFFYLVFTGGTIVQKYRTSDESLAGNITIGTGNWNTMTLTSDGKFAFIVDWSAEGKVKYLDLENLTVLQTYEGANGFVYPHGCCLSPDNKTLYVTAQTGNFIYKIDVSAPLYPTIDEIALGNNESPNSSSKYDPHELIFSADGSKYFVTCQKSNEVRVMDAITDKLITSIPTGIMPLELVLSEKHNLLFVTCQEDDVLFSTATQVKRGAVSIIDVNTLSLVKNVYPGFQPHGISANDAKDLVYIANRNISPDGPAPHHINSCGGKNGYISFLDMNTLEVAKQTHEVSVDPYSIGLKESLH